MECAWCKKELEEAQYPSLRDFHLSFEVGTTSDIFGPNIRGYEIEDMCTDCAWKLRDAVEDLGIEIQEIDI